MRWMLLISMLLMSYASAECIHERRLLGSDIMSLKSSKNYRIHIGDGIFKPLAKTSLIPINAYLVHEDHEQKRNFDRYNRKHIEYYRYKRMQDYIGTVANDFQNLDYKIEVVGQSLAGRDLYGIYPVQMSPAKKTIVMFGRHHGDEGTANWIIEGFVNEFLKSEPEFHEEFQLVLYPMINPDGAETASRYNENDRDLNRAWSFDISKNYDEAKTIHTHLKQFLDHPAKKVIVLDMHGSFTEDFIYRVNKKFISTDFFQHQQDFIDELATHDIWQKGNFKLSDGHPKMARIVMVNDYKLNALTHETPRDIKLKNRDKRSKQDLFDQGAAVFKSIYNSYFHALD